MNNCSPYQHTYEYECTLEDCQNKGDDDCSCPVGLTRDCNCDCRDEGTPSFAYLTDCGCNTAGGVCPTNCGDEHGQGISYLGPSGLVNENFYCFFSAIECPVKYGCMDDLSESFDPEATIDDGSCIYDEIQSIMYKPSIEKMWMFRTTLSAELDPTENFQIDNFNNMIYEGVYGVSNIYYLEIFINDLKINNINSMIFAFINNQLRGFSNVNNDGYCFLEVKWMENLEPNEIITFYVKHNNEIRRINEIKTFDNQLVNNAYTTTSIYDN